MKACPECKSKNITETIYGLPAGPPGEELQKEIDRLREERDDLLDRVSAANTMAKNLRQANLNLIHAAHDNG